MVGQWLGPYHVLEKLGEGGMGEVYRARDARLDRDVAVKVLPAAFASDRDRVTRFEREAKAIAALSHPNIVSIFDTGADAGQVFVVTELLDGETLRARLSSALPVRKATDIAMQIARGLAAAHDKGIVHRDLKPENVFLTQDGQVKILDFGLARQMSTNTGVTETVSAMTDPGTVMGTVGYMAPEQVRGQAVDARTDLFALGAVLYEMVSGRRAFHRDTTADTMFAIVREDPLEIGTTRADVPPALHRIIRRCLDKNPAERFQTARDLAFALEALSGSESRTATTTTIPGPRPVRRVLWLAAAIALTAAAYIAGRYQVSRGTGLPIGWKSEFLGGPLVAYSPRISPNGQDLAFAAMVGIQTQVALLKTESGDWQAFGQDATRGVAQGFAWTPNGDRLYFTRYNGGQDSIFWTSPLPGSEEKLLVANARAPQPLKDGSVLLAKFGPSGRAQIYRFWPEGERFEALDALSVGQESFRALPDGQHVVFFGHPASAPSNAPSSLDHLFVVALTPGAVPRKLAPDVTIPKRDWLFPLAVSPDGMWVFLDLPAGDAHRIVAVRSDGSPGVYPLFTLTHDVLGIDVGPDWSVYVNQIEQPAEVRWYSKPGASPVSVRVPGGACVALPLDDHRAVEPLSFVGRKHLMVVEAGKPLVPLIDTQEETDFPLARLGPDRLVLIAGSGSTRRVALASIATGRLVGPIEGITPNAIRSLAGSPDGKTIFYDAEGFIWAKAVAGGEATKIRPGSFVAMDRSGKYLMVKQRDADAIRLFNVPWPSGTGTEREILVQPGDLQVTADWIAPRAIGPDGRLVIRVGVKTSWFYPAAVLDPGTGRFELLDSVSDHDMCGPGWSDSGGIVSAAVGFESTLLRFRPQWK